MNGDELTDEQLLYIVANIDREAFQEGMEIRQRSFEVIGRVMKKLGYLSWIMFGEGRPEIVDRIYAAYSRIYRPQDLAVGGHIGVFMYRDIFARLAVPMGFGTFAIEPFKHVELTETQLRMMNFEPDQVEMFLDQFFDVADIQYGSDELNKPYNEQESTVRFIGLARLHLHAASAVVTGGYDYRGAVQSALLATELALKAGASAQGLDEAQIKKQFDHRLIKIAEFVGAAWREFDLERVRRVIASQPLYVPNRYSQDQPKRLVVGHTIMGAQYIVSEVVRRMSDRNFRIDGGETHPRRYPA